jgi:nitrogenase molybdenum-iron protein alpha/beta subunit
VKRLEVLPPGAGEPRPGGPDWSDRLSLTFVIGAYVAVNAIRDAYLLVDAPDCAHLKTQYLQGNHDWFSSLTRTDGYHRVANTDLHPWKMVAARDASVEAQLRRLAEHAGCGVALVTSLPMATITGLDYDRLARRVASATGKPAANLPADGLTGDWLDGYAATLDVLARTLPLDPSRRRSSSVAIVGHLMDRNEGDQLANVAELRRLVEALGLRVASIWLSGGSTAELRAVEEASLVVSLPYGRSAARTLAKRLDVPLVETDLPLGLDGTERWLREVAGAAGAGARLPAVLDAELGRAAPRVEWVIPYHLLHRRMVFVGDPHLGLALSGLADELGMEVEHYFVLNRKAHAKALIERAGAAAVTCDPKRDAFNAAFQPMLAEGRCDVVVTNATCVSPGPPQVATVELGFPSFYTHALDDRPFLFSRGFLGLVERILNELRRAELASAGR